MNEYTPDFLAQALHAYMDSFQIFQEDLSTYETDEDSGERQKTSATVMKHVLVGDELPSMQGFSVKMRIPIRKLRDLYNTRSQHDPDCPWVLSVDIFKSYMESTLASAAAFDLINASFAKEVMKQWVGWQTDIVVLDDRKTELAPTEASARIAAILAKVMPAPAIATTQAAAPQIQPLHATPPVLPIPIDPAQVVTTEMASEVVQKRRPRKL